MSKKLFTKFFVFLLVVGLLFAVAPAKQALAADIPVACLGTDDTALLQGAITGATDGDVINVSGTCVLSANITVSKDVTLDGGGTASIKVSGTGYRITMTTAGATLQGFDIEKTDKTGLQEIIWINASNVTVTNNKVHGQFVIGDGEVSRAIVISGGNSGLLITGNEFYALRQPAYISGVTTGTISNNYTHGTKGWVVEGGNLTFTGNTWGTGVEANVYDIALLTQIGSLYYTDVPAMSAANNNAFIEDQRYSTPLLTPVYVDASVSTCTDCGTARMPYDTIQEGVDRVIPGGTVHVAAGDYSIPSTMTLAKAITVSGPTTGEAKLIKADGITTNNIFLITASDVTIQNLTLTLNGAPTKGDAFIQAPDGAKANIQILNNKIYVDPQVGPMTGWQAQAIYFGRYTTNSKINNNTIYNTRSGAVAHYNCEVEYRDNVIYNTKGGIMNYTGSLADAANRTMTGNSWGTAHNEWDIVWNTGGAPYDMDMNIYVLQVSQANNDAYVCSLMSTLVPQSTLKGNRSHVFVSTTGTTTVKYDNGNINLPYAKIQDAIDAVVPGGKVIVASGTYYGSVVVNKALNLVSTSGAATTIINGGATSANLSAGLYIVSIRASDVTLDGFTITNPLFNSTWSSDPTGIMIGYYGDNSLSNIQVTNNIVTQINDPNFIVNYSAPHGIVVNGVVAGLEIDHNVIHDLASIVPVGYGGTTGIALYGYDTTPLSTLVTIHDNEIYDLRVVNQAGGTAVARGIRTGWGAGEATITANNIHDFAGIGIQTNYYTNAAITITENTITDTAIGVSMEHPAGGLITDNIISGDGTGIQLGASVTTAPTITGNNVNMTVLQFHDGSTAAVANMTTVYSGSSNTWAPFSIISGRDILVPAPVHNVTKDTYFSTIQAAINDAGTTDGDVIVARGGLYVENVNVTKEVTLLGARDLVDFSLPISTTTWYVDRYAPAVFESANVAGEMVLRHGVRAPAQPSSFYNNQGRGYDLGLTGTSQTVSINLFVDTGWTSGQQSAGLWGVGVDSTVTVSAYPILAWRNVTGGTPGFYTFDYINGGYYLLKAAEAGDYGKWHTLTFTLTPGIGVVYSVDGVTSTFADPDTTNIKSLILNVYNFGVDYDVLWDNLLTSSTTDTATVQGQMTINASNVTVDGFTLTNPGQKYGLLVNSAFAHIDITNNVFENIGATTLAQDVKGIYLQNGPDDVLIEGNIFRNIHAGAKSVNPIYVGDTAATNSTQGLIIRNNSFTNITSATKGGYGILFNNRAGTEGVIISGNTFDTISGGWTHAIGLEGPTPGALVTGNTFTNLTAISPDNSAVFFEDNPAGGTVAIEGNKFLNVGYGVLIHPKHAPYTYTVDASPNYWGSACGPTAAGANVGQNITYSPWYTDEAMTATSAAATTYDFTPSTGTVAINAAIACAAPGSTFNFAIGGYSAGFVVPAGRDHMTLVFADGAVVTATSPCFAVGADFTTIKAEHIGMASCVTVAGSNGIDVAAGLRNLTVDGFEIYGAGNDGIHYNGVIFDTVLKDNYIHNLAGNGVYFGAQPVELTPGGIDIHGNLFQANTLLGMTNPNGTAAIDATYNSWGDVAGPSAGDGVGPYVTATPFTHVDVYMVASGTPWTGIPLNQVVTGQQITFKVMAHVVNALTVDVKLAYPTNLTGAVPSFATSAFPSFAEFDPAAPANTIWFHGMAPSGTGGYLPVTGDVELFTVTFTGGTPGLNLPMNLDELSDVFGMEGVGSSSNIYAVALLDSTVNVIALPVIDIVPVLGQTYIAGMPINFNVVITNLYGANYADIGLEFETGASDYVEFLDTDNVWKPYPGVVSWGALATNGTDLTPVLPLFRVTFFDPGVNTINLTMLDRPTVDDIWLDDTFEDFTLLGDFTVTGTFSMQGRSTRAGIPATLDYQDLVAYTDKTGTTINQISFNLVIPEVNGGHWLLTTLQPRYLNVIAANGKIVMVDGNETLIALQLKGGNAVWTDNVIDIPDASEVGTHYGETTGVNELSLLDADVNFDGKVNIQDLALVGGNFDLTSEVAYGVGNLQTWLVQ